MKHSGQGLPRREITGIISAMQSTSTHQRLRWVGMLILAAVALAACNQTSPPLVSPQPSPTQFANIPTDTPLPPTATPTPEPLAARVNGEGISQATFEAELDRYQAAVGTQLATVESASQVVLDELISQTLLAQAAAAEGFTLDETTLEDRIAALASQMGGEAALQTWLEAHQYDQASFRTGLGRAVAAAWMRDRLAAEVPEAVEQVHARQISFNNAEEAALALARLQAGEDFDTLAAEFDPLTQGDLGWFPRGYLTDPLLEEAAFRLQPEEHSEVIATTKGYHLLQVIERAPEHPLSPDARLVLQSQVLNEWLAERRAASEIEILLP